MADGLPPSYLGTDQGPRLSTLPDGSVGPGYPPQPTPGYPPAAGYFSQPGQPGYPPAQFNASFATGYPPPEHGHMQQPVRYCGNNTNTTFVVTQQPTITAPSMTYLNDHMSLSTFSCLFCCLCIGIFAINKSSEARRLYNAGHYTQALAAATAARNLSISSIICGSIFWLVFVIVVIVLVV